MASGALPAFGTYVSLAGTELAESEWSVRFSGGLVDVTSFLDGGFSDRIKGVRDAEIEVKGFWNFEENLHAAPYNVIPGATLTGLLLGVTSLVDLVYDFPVFIIDEVRVNAAVRDGLRLEFRAYNRGIFGYPGVSNPTLPDVTIGDIVL